MTRKHTTKNKQPTAHEVDQNRRLCDMELHRLDQVVVAAEARWGIGNLTLWADDGLREKWRSQKNKINDAYEQADFHLLSLLVDGAVRGVSALEANAQTKGMKPCMPDFMEVELESGFRLRIAKNIVEARQVSEKGVVVWSLEEVAKVIEKDYTLVNQIKDSFVGAELSELKAQPNRKLEDDVMPF